uniref:histidine kinase n=1 Tax=Kalanchoe fedtschenkoi TaxID=63787 RepID=A0A7N0ZZQ3_KALFE
MKLKTKIQSTPQTDSPMKSTLRSVLDHTQLLSSCPCRKIKSRSPAAAAAPRGRRIFTSSSRDVEHDDPQLKLSSHHCLSSYYSVFVARLTIMVMLAILIGLLTILTWHFTRVYTTKSLNSLAYGLRYELLQRPILRMWNILNSTVEITTAQVKLSEYVIRKHDNPTSQAEQVELYEEMKDVTWALFASHHALNAITINYRNGFVQAFHRDHRRNNTFYIYSDLSNYSISGTYDVDAGGGSSRGWNDQAVHNNITATWYREPLDPLTGERTGKALPILPDDLINIAGLSQVPDGNASWHVAVSKYSNSPLLSAALPVWDASKESIVAVVGVTTALYSVGQLMKELVEFHSGHIYLTSQAGYLLATSTNAPLLTTASGKPQLVMPVDSEDPVIRSGAEWLKQTYGDSPLSNHEVHEANAKLGRQEYYIDSFFLNLKRLPMVGVILLPRKYIMGKVEERAFKTVVILISASFSILVIGCVFILILTNGLSKEMKLRAELISHLDARRKAEASSNYKTQFLANMSHELRTPMAAVIGLLDILISDDCLTNEQYDTVTQIRKCSTALLRLLNNILDISKVESGKLVLEVVEFDLGKELEALIDMFSVQCINHNVEIVIDLSDDMPRLIQGDSARVVQIFANLISNSIKFTTSGHIILRGWCESLDNSKTDKLRYNQEELQDTFKSILGLQGRRTYKKDDRIVLWFEVDDTGCGIDPSKWESVFESFEQADPSTTRTHGGTGLGLCIVRTLVRKMGGEIKVIRKNGPGTLMRLCLLLGTPAEFSRHQHGQVNYGEHKITVLLAISGNVGRRTVSNWLQNIGVSTWEASEWNELTEILSENFQPQKSAICSSGFHTGDQSSKGVPVEMDDLKPAFVIIVVDIGLLDLRTDIWKEQLNFLTKYHDKVKFAWMINHDTANAVKIELRRKGYYLTVNKPLYKVKVTQILDTFLNERNLVLDTENENEAAMGTTSQAYECHEICSVHQDADSSDDSDKSETEETYTGYGNNDRDEINETELQTTGDTENNNAGSRRLVLQTESRDERFRLRDYAVIPSVQKGQGSCNSYKELNELKALEGLRIMLAEDTPVLQRVATIMLEKMGAAVFVVGDGLQAVEALKFMVSDEDSKHLIYNTERNRSSFEASMHHPPFYDLILMDCQVSIFVSYLVYKFLFEVLN